MPRREPNPLLSIPCPLPTVASGSALSRLTSPRCLLPRQLTSGFLGPLPGLGRRFDGDHDEVGFQPWRDPLPRSQSTAFLTVGGGLAHSGEVEQPHEEQCVDKDDEQRAKIVDFWLTVKMFGPRMCRLPPRKATTDR